MKPSQTKLFPHKRQNSKILIIGTIILTMQLVFHLTVGAKPHSNRYLPDSIGAELNNQLRNSVLMEKLNFPNTVKRFYTLNNQETNWLRPAQNIGATASAMLLLDCVRHYGLQHENYHPEVLNYGVMQDVLDSKNSASAAKKVEYELMLTDAMISMINHLHYGQLNPSLSTKAIDNDQSLKLRAAEFLLKIANSSNLMDSILTVQPSISQYKKLQTYMELITGQYACDSYETPESEVKVIALNMERLRWAGVDSPTYLHVNIPSFQLTYIMKDATREFKVVVGKPSTPTPTLASAINYFETAPDWRIPNKIFIKELLPKAEKNLAYFENNHIAIYDEKENFIPVTIASLIEIKNQPKKYHARQSAGCDNALGKVVFRFDNSHSIYLHDTPEQQYFSRLKRALSHGCIRVENAESLAAILLENDGQRSKIEQLNAAMPAYKKQKFTLKTPLPILITYLTVTVEDGLLAKHEDIYKLDKALEAQLYAKAEQPTNIIQKK